MVTRMEPEPTAEQLVAGLHELVKARSSVPKMAAEIGLSYDGLRDNLRGTSEMKLSTYIKLLNALNLTEAQLREYALLLGPASTE